MHRFLSFAFVIVLHGVVIVIVHLGPRSLDPSSILQASQLLVIVVQLQVIVDVSDLWGLLFWWVDDLIVVVFELEIVLRLRSHVLVLFFGLLHFVELLLFLRLLLFVLIFALLLVFVLLVLLFLYFFDWWIVIAIHLAISKHVLKRAISLLILLLVVFVLLINMIAIITHLGPSLLDLLLLHFLFNLLRRLNQSQLVLDFLLPDPLLLHLVRHLFLFFVFLLLLLDARGLVIALFFFLGALFFGGFILWEFAFGEGN